MNDKDIRRCERCGKPISLSESDYCALCSRNLCDPCMDKGCCGHTPAKSGVEQDYRYDEDGTGGGTCTPKAPAP